MVQKQHTFYRNVNCILVGAFLICGAAAARGKETLGPKHIAPVMDGCFQLHVKYHELTPALAALTLSNFVEALDYGKAFMLQQDVARAYAYTNEVVKGGQADWSFIFAIYRGFLRRLDEQQSNSVAYLRNPALALEDQRAIVIDAKKRPFPATPAAAERLLEDSLQYQLAYLVSIGETFTGAVVRVVKRRERLAKRFHELRSDQQLGLFLNAFCRALDPHSAYLSPDDYEDFQIQMALTLKGIGAVLSADDNGVTVISSLTPGGPADNSGMLKPNDKIVAVAQGQKPFVDIIDMDLRDVVKLIRGEKGTVVRLTVVRKSKKGTKRFVTELTRDQVRLEDQAARMEYITLARTNKNHSVTTFHFAAIDLPSFYFDPKTKTMFGKYEKSAVEDVRRLLETCQTARVDGVILDLQQNGGGALEEAVDVAGLFIREGNIVMATDRRNSCSVLADTDASIRYRGPLVVTVSRATASGAEIVAGAVQDYGRALIVGGDHTFGKSTIQQVVPLPEGLGALKITVGEYFIASGRSMQCGGVKPDIILPSTLSALEIGEQYEPNALPGDQLDSQLSDADAIGSDSGGWARVSTQDVQRISANSARRVQRSAQFADIRKGVGKILEDRRKTIVTIASLIKDGGTNQLAATDPDALNEEDDATTNPSRRRALTNDAVVLESAYILADMIDTNYVDTSGAEPGPGFFHWLRRLFSARK